MDQVDISFILDSHWYGGLYYLLNTTDTWQQWIEGEAKSYHYTPEVAEKLYKVLGANRYIIHDRRVIDLACNLGYMSLACSNMGARWVLGVEARDIYIKPFNQVLDHWPTKNVSMVQGDIENTDFLETIIKGYDTILYSGHFYYQSTHEKIIEIFTKSQCSAIIIESLHPSNNHLLDEIFYQQDNAVDLLGTINAKITGAPTIVRTQKLLESFGWHVAYKDTIKAFDTFVITATR